MRQEKSALLSGAFQLMIEWMKGADLKIGNAGQIEANQLVWER